MRIPWIRIILFVIVTLVMIVINSVDTAVMDDVAVKSLNDPAASRAMVVRENNIWYVNVLGGVVIFGSLVWVISGMFPEDDEETTSS